MQRIFRISLCIAIPFAVAMLFSLFTYFASWPQRWKYLDAEYLLAIATMGALYYAAVPLLALCLASLRRTPTSLISILVASLWLILLFLLRAKKPWVYYGHFPTWMLWRDIIQPLPISLAFGLVFAVCARNFLSPNPSFKWNALKRAP